jgi:uncharacterized protein YyaL (SSP411 family)
MRVRRLAGAVTTCGLLMLAPAASARAASAAKGIYLRLAEQGMGEQSMHWRTSAHGWYCEVLRCSGAFPLLTIWGIVRMFESADAVQLADASATHNATVERLAGQSEQLYWNRYLHGYDPYPGDDFPAAQAWFDDNGWLGLAFIDAYRATGERRWVGDAQRGLDFVVAHGWDGASGMWWNTEHQHHSGEALAADSLLATMLYGINHDSSDLAQAHKWIDWANAHDIGYAGLYDSQGPDSTVIDYVEAPLIYAQYLLCHALSRNTYCRHAAQQSNTLTQIYGVRYDLAPLYDSIFFQWMMAYDRATGDGHWITVAQANAAAAMRHATNGHGLWLDGWWGGAISDPNTQPGMFRTMAGTTSLYAWLAYYA